MNREKQRHHNVLSTKANNGELVKRQGLQGEDVLALSDSKRKDSECHLMSSRWPGEVTDGADDAGWELLELRSG